MVHLYFFYNVSQKVPFLMARPQRGEGKGLVTQKKNFFWTLKKFHKKNEATKLEGEGGKA